MISILELFVLFSAVAASVGFFLQVRKAYSFGRNRFHAEAGGKGARGVLFAFTRGMTPAEKESAAGHPFSYAAGILFHLGVFSAFLHLFSVLFSFSLPAWSLPAVRILLGAGLLSGLGLLMKRMVLPHLRRISVPDDYVSNILVDIFLALALLRTWYSGLNSIFLLISGFLILSIPLSKIRHCLFFFISRFFLGLFFGRRGVLPPKAREAE